MASLTKLIIHIDVASCGLGDVCSDILYWSSDVKPNDDQTSIPFFESAQNDKVGTSSVARPPRRLIR